MVVLSVVAASTAMSPLGIAYWASPIAVLVGLPLYLGRTRRARLQFMVGAGLGAALAFGSVAAWFQTQTGDFVQALSPLRTWLTTVAGGLLGIAFAAGARGVMSRLARRCG